MYSKKPLLELTRLSKGKIEVDVNKWNVDLMSISGHKIYAPKVVLPILLKIEIITDNFEI